MTGRGGAAGTGGVGGAQSTTVSSCGAPALNMNPFPSCKFAWGTNDNSLSYAQFVSHWVEPGIKSDGSFPSCGGCTWLKNSVASTSLIPVYYAYMIGYYGHANGLPDQNNNPNGANLSTGGGALITNNRAKVLQIYSSYAQQTYAAWKTKPLVWLLEGDFIQYHATTQTTPLTIPQLGQLAADIACAIKTNMPNAVVAVNHTTWNSDADTIAFWTAMQGASIDMVWTTGVANNSGYFDASETSTTYNATTANYAYVHQLTGKTLYVDTSFGQSNQADTWSTASAATLNQLIANGVIAIDVNPVPNGYQTAINSLSSQLSTTCH